jgi:outer membrane protein assembly factor BamE (lipoprotein component of BamABCDE complex)
VAGRVRRSVPESSAAEFEGVAAPAGQGEFAVRREDQQNHGRRPRRAAMAVLALSLLLGGCITQTYQRGYIVPEGALEQIPLGASQEQVLIVLSTPSTVATVSGEVFYYISQRAEQTSFLPQQEVDRRVIAVYFDKNRKVERLANYGIKDGRVFDFVSRTTPTAGQDLNYVAYMIKAMKFW